MKRLRLEYSGGLTDIIMDLNFKTILSAEFDIEKLIEMDAEYFYTSRSGLSGACNFFTDDNHPWVELGCYRPDTRSEQRARKVNGLFVYLPVISHKKIDMNWPCVISNGRTVLFCEASNLLEAIADFDKFIESDLIKKKITYEIEWYDNMGYEHFTQIEIVMVHPYLGVNATRFVDLRDARSHVNGNPYLNHGTLAYEMGLDYYPKKDITLYKHWQGYYSEKINGRVEDMAINSGIGDWTRMDTPEIIFSARSHENMRLLGYNKETKIIKETNTTIFDFYLNKTSILDSLKERIA